MTQAIGADSLHAHNVNNTNNLKLCKRKSTSQTTIEMTKREEEIGIVLKMRMTMSSSGWKRIESECTRIFFE